MDVSFDWVKLQKGIELFHLMKFDKTNFAEFQFTHCPSVKLLIKSNSELNEECIYSYIQFEQFEYYFNLNNLKEGQL